jgi:hypothetical protein
MAQINNDKFTVAPRAEVANLLKYSYEALPEKSVAAAQSVRQIARRITPDPEVQIPHSQLQLLRNRERLALAPFCCY